MTKPLTALVALAALTGCSEHWYSWDDAALDLDLSPSTEVDARVVTPPGAWPRELYDHAVRVKLEGESVTFIGEVYEGQLLDEPREIDDHWGDNVNILDAWRDCDPGAECDRTFRFEVSCAGTARCAGTVTADAFLAVEHPPQHRARTGVPLELTLSAIQVVDGAAGG